MFVRICLVVVVAVASAAGHGYLRPKAQPSQKDLAISAAEENGFWERYLQASVPPGPTPPPSSARDMPMCLNPLWSDEFSSDALDSSVWNYDNGRGNGGWGNQELQFYQSENIRVQDGRAIITVAEEDDGTFTSTRINTMDKVEVLYGTMEARIKLPENGLNNGLWPAFWTLGGNFREVSWPACGEIDILEMGAASAIQDNTANRRVISAVHWDFEGNRADFATSIDVSMDLNDGEFHIFRMEWTSSRITTFVDDNVIMEFDIGLDVCADCTEFHQPHFMILNVAVGGRFTDILDESGISVSLPAEFEVDYVRVCDNGETVVTGSVIEDLVDFEFDCGLPRTCTTSALNNYADEARCGDRIQFLIDSGSSVEGACRQVANDEFPERISLW
ncbi:MAG: hypothetical protein SGILL_002494 [Bacillariaceae sp.]